MFTCPKKIPIPKYNIEQHNQQQNTNTVSNNSKDDTLNSSIKNIDIRINNISYAYTDGYLIGKIFNDLMKNGYDSVIKQNKYIIQIVEKFWLFRVRSDRIFFEIYYRDLNNETILLIEDYTKDCKTPKEKYEKLNGIMTEVIACITKQSEHLIISKTIDIDKEWLKTSINEIRESVSLKWKIVDG